MAGCFDANNDKTARLELKNALVISQNYIVGEDVKLNGQMFNCYKSINDNSATDGTNTLKIFAMSKNQIRIVNNSDDSTYILELIAILTIKNGSFSHFFY